MEKYNSYCTFLTETWLNPNIEEAEVHIDEYKLIRSDRCDRLRGGAAIYIRD